MILLVAPGDTEIGVSAPAMCATLPYNFYVTQRLQVSEIRILHCFTWSVFYCLTMYF